jgi:hypothetical protein
LLPLLYSLHPLAIILLLLLLLYLSLESINFTTMPKLSFDNLGEFSQARANEVFDSHKKYLDWRKTEWATRGPAALATRMEQRSKTHTSWRQMKGMELVKHEMNHPGNKPFVIGMA